MSDFSEDDDDMFLSELHLDEIVSKEIGKSEQNTSKDPLPCGDEFDDDDDILFLGEVDSLMAGQEEKPFGSVVPKTETPKKASVAIPKAGTSRPLNIPTTTKSSNIPEGGSWSEFTNWMRKQACFKTGWFQTTPILHLNALLCKGAILECKDLSQLLQISNIVLAFLRDVHVNVPTGNEYFLDDMIKVLEMIFTKLERDLANQIVSSAQLNHFEDVFNEITESYITAKLSLGTTAIPQSLVNVYPNAFERILNACIKNGQPDLLLSVITNRPDNFTKVYAHLFKLHSNDCDSDFQDNAHNPHQLASQLLGLIMAEVTENSATIPSVLQPLICFDCVISKLDDKNKSNELIINHAYSLLNDLFHYVQTDACLDKDFTAFILSLLPFTTAVLNNTKLMKNVRFKEHPNLWIFTNKSIHFG